MPTSREPNGFIFSIPATRGLDYNHDLHTRTLRTTLVTLGPSRSEIPMPISTTSHPVPVIAPSMLKCDFGDLNREVDRLSSAGSRWLHWDVMDGNFVPNLSYGAMVIQSVRARTNAFFDAHLMISHPEKYLDDYIKAGCDAITIHIEAAPEPREMLKRIRSAGRQAGLALNPGTPVSRVEPFLEECDLVLVMSVEPGFGGQKFMPHVLDKFQQLKTRASSQTLLSIDGGIAAATIGQAYAAGCQIFVAGSAIFDEPDYRLAIETLERMATAKN